jgi:hypothetical protein
MRAMLAALIALAGAVSLPAQSAGAPAQAAGAPLLVLADTTLFPEGIVRDAARQRWLLSSIRQRTIVAVDDRGHITPYARDLPAGTGAVIGLGIDHARGLLYAATAALPPMLGFTPADTLRAEVLMLDLASGVLRRRIALPESPRHRAPGDLTVAADGTVYVSDGFAKRLYVIAPSGEVRTISSSLFNSLQGSVLTRDGRALIVSDYRMGLLRVPLEGTDTVTVIADSAGRRLAGVDGLAWHGEALIVTYNGRLPGRVMRVVLTADQRAIVGASTLETVPGAGEPTLGVVMGDDFIFIANSPWSAFDDAGARKPGTTMAPPEIRRLPLPR